MNDDWIPDNPYLLLTPGPLSTTKTVRAAMLRDWCTWDREYNSIVQDIRFHLTRLAAGERSDQYTTALMQGSGTFSVESVIGSCMEAERELLVLTNGAYGRRIVEIAKALRIPVRVHDSGETRPPDPDRLATELKSKPEISHVAVVHCETTTGMLNPLKDLAEVIRRHERRFILDAMSSFGGVEFDPVELGVDFLVSSANKCIQGAPGFGFIVARRSALEECRGRARSLSLDLYDQWRVMEEQEGKWRYTSPTHVVHAFARALNELDAEGGIPARALRYRRNQQRLASGMGSLGFRPFHSQELQSPIITSFRNPEDSRYSFARFYEELKRRGFVIYPGKVSEADTFRIGSIGDVQPEDMDRLVAAVRESIFWR